MGTSRTREASVSSRSRRLVSAQWMSSNRSSVGPPIASDSTKTLAEKNRVSRSEMVRSPSSPSSTSSCGACSSAAAGPASSARPVASFARASAGSSLSKMCAICLTCCPKAPYGVLAPYGVERPRTTRAPWAATSCDSSSARRDFPIPAGPKTVTNWARPSSVTRSQIPMRTPSSRSRPIIGTAAIGRSPACDVARRACQARTGALLPFARTGWAGRYSTALRVAAYVSSPTRTAPTGAALWSRAAVFTTSPATIASPWPGRASSSTIASPVFTAIRTSSPSCFRPVADGERRAYGALGVVAVRRRRTEDAHHRVPDELLDRAAVALELLADALVVRREDRAHVLRIELLGTSGEADEVDEEDGDRRVAPRPAVRARPAPRRTRYRTWRGRDSPARSVCRSARLGTLESR